MTEAGPLHGCDVLWGVKKLALCDDVLKSIQQWWRKDLVLREMIFAVLL